MESKINENDKAKKNVSVRGGAGMDFRAYGVEIMEQENGGLI
jgi:hypothetical protein